MHNLDSNHVTYGNLVAEAERDYNFFFLPLWFDRIFAKWWKILSSKWYIYIYINLEIVKALSNFTDTIHDLI